MENATPDPLLHALAKDFADGGIQYHRAYEGVHLRNLRLVQALREGDP